MLRVGLACLVTTGLVSAFVVQVPLHANPVDPWQEDHARILDGKVSREWDFNALPNPNATDHLVFETVHSLLQRWPNTRMRNGHNIVPGVIPTGTIFYHGTDLSELPHGAGWVATSPEHAHFFCQDDLFDRVGPECWIHTLATTRAIKVAYFDGQSAARIPYGTFDTQDLIVWGEILPDTDDWERAEGLCDWGKKNGLGGFVRMGMSFEVILCDFTSAIRVISSTNIAHPGSAKSGISQSFVSFETIHAGSWQNHFPGEIRLQLDLAGLVSFYDTKLAPSLNIIQVDQERWDHRAGNVSSEDFSGLKSRLEKNLARPSGQTSGIDWKALIHVIVDRLANRFELMRHLLSSPSVDPDQIVDLTNKTQTQLRIILSPFLPISAVPTDPSNKLALEWTAPIYRLCATTYTSFTESEMNLMTDSERLILRAVRGVTRETCRVMTKMWAAGVYVGIDTKLNKKESLDIVEVTDLRNTWVEDLKRLMTWLDWNVWVKCNPGCESPEEICYLPTFPINLIAERWASTNFDVQSTVLDDLSEVRNVLKPEPGEWDRPQPKCVRRVYPYTW